MMFGIKYKFYLRSQLIFLIILLISCSNYEDYIKLNDEDLFGKKINITGIKKVNNELNFNFELIDIEGEVCMESIDAIYGLIINSLKLERVSEKFNITLMVNSNYTPFYVSYSKEYANKVKSLFEIIPYKKCQQLIAFLLTPEIRQDINIAIQNMENIND